MYEFFYNQHVLKSKPIVIREFFDADQLKELRKYCKDTDETYNIGPLQAHQVNHRPPVKTEITDGLDNDPRVIVNPQNRVWKHKKGNLTDWHWDGNGADLLNISIQGSKEFYLAPPDSFLVLPLTPQSVPGIHRQETMKFTIYPGDMLYLPAYWFHKVYTLEDAVNINYSFYPKKRRESSRATDLHNLHKMFKTLLCKKDIMCTLDRPDTRVRACFRALFEIIPYVFLFYVLCYFVPMYIVILVFFFMVFLTNTAYFGMPLVFAVFLGVWVAGIELIKYLSK